MIGAVWKLIILTSMANKIINSSTNETKRDEVTGEWRRLHNEELSDLYS